MNRYILKIIIFYEKVENYGDLKSTFWYFEILQVERKSVKIEMIIKG